MQVRQAILDDAHAIGALFRSRIDRWQRMTAQGDVEDLPYQELSVYERWLHGGPWMSIETSAIWLNHLLRGAGLPLVVVDGSDAMWAYAEAFPGDEAPPIGPHLHVAHLLTSAQAPAETRRQMEEMLMEALLEVAAKSGRLMASCSAYDSEMAAFFRRYGMSPLERIQRLDLAAQTGQGFYKATDHADTDAAQIAGWGMPIGRLTSARQQWEELWSNLWAAVPQIAAQRLDRQQFFASGQEAFVCFRQQLYAPRSAEVYCWTPRSLSTQLVVAIRDWAHRQGYRTLTMAVSQKAARMLAAEAETVPHQHEIYTRDV